MPVCASLPFSPKPLRRLPSRARFSRGDTVTIYLSLAVALIALAVYLLSSNEKIREPARIAWACGLLAFLLRVAELPSIRQG